MTNDRIGLVLEGGGLRGIYTAGVLDCFLEHDIDLRHVFAVSAGACHACSYLAGQHGRAYATNTGYLHNRHYCSLYSLITTGDLFGVDFLYHELPEKLYPIDNETFRSKEPDFHPVVTNCITGQAEYPKVEDLFRDIDFVRASSSLPVVSRLVMLNGVPYLDGGLSDPIPLRHSEEEGFSKNIVVLTRDRSYRKEAAGFQTVFLAKYRAYPSLTAIMAVRHHIYNGQLDHVRRAEEEGRAFVIAPSVPLELGRMEKDREKLDAIYRLGKRDTEERLDALLDFLKN